MILIEIIDEFVEKVEESWLADAVEKSLQFAEAAESAELTIRVTDDAELERLNSEYLGTDAPTDVLSFPSGEEIDPESGFPYLGDIIISFPRALAQANTGGHPVKDELQLLAIHGVLHLLGWDHADPEEKQAMWLEQAQILSSLGSQITGPGPE
jgi:probable rRNA maturation factor